MRRFLPFSLAVLLLALPACDELRDGKPFRTTAADLAASRPTPSTPVPLLGTGIDSGNPPARGGTRAEIIDGGVTVSQRPPAASGPAAPGDGEPVSFNFVDAEIPSVVRVVLGDLLKLNFAIDPRVSGRITLQTSAPLPREALLPALEDALRMNGTALVRVEGSYKVVPAEEARFAYGVTDVGTNRGPGWRTQIVPLRNAKAEDVQKALEAMTPAGVAIKSDPVRNLVFITGSGTEIGNLLDAVAILDVDTLAGRSFGLIRLDTGDAKSVARELEAMVGRSEQSAVRIVAVPRINAVMAVARQPATLRRIQQLAEKLDRPQDGAMAQIFVYRVAHGRAAHLAEVLAKLYPQYGVERAGTERGGNGQSSLGARSSLGGGSGSGSAMSSGGAGGLGGASGESSLSIAGPGSDDSANIPSRLPGETGRSESAGGAPGGGSGGSTGSPSGSGGNPVASLLDPGSGSNYDSGSGVRIVADTVNNALIIHARPSVWKQIEQTIRRLDVVPVQVLIETTIAEVRLNDQLKFGVQYYIGSPSGARFSNQANGGVAIPPTTPGFSYFYNAPRVSVLVDALKGVTDVNILSTPSMLVLDNQTARLQVGDQVPILSQQSISTQTIGAPVVNQIQMKDTGILLAVTPRISSSGLVILDVRQEVSDVVTTTSSRIDSPTFQQRRLESSIAVANGETVALGGLIRTNQQRANSGIPELSEIPVLGALFGSRSDAVERTELLVLITPRIVRDPAQARSVTDDLRRALAEPRKVPRPRVLP